MGGAYSQAEGVLAEYQAAKFLEKKGYCIIAHNVNYHRIGELDIVCTKGSLLVIVEVKYRSTGDVGEPIEAVTPSKIKKICRATERFIEENAMHDYDVRFDVICIKDGIIEHVEDAFYGTWLG